MRLAILLTLALLLAGMAVGITPPNTGDVTGVTAGTWLSGGGTAGSLTITGDSAAIVNYIRARFYGLADIDGTSIDTNGSGQLIVDTTSAALAEMVADRIGAMLAGNTETFITVTYDDADNTIDFVVGVVDSATGAARATWADSSSAIDTSYAPLIALINSLAGGGTGWNWADSSSHGPDSVLFADSANHADVSDSSSAIDTSYAPLIALINSLTPDDSSFVSITTDTVNPIGAGGLNLEGKTGGVRILDSESERFRFEGDSLMGPGKIAKDFRQVNADTLDADAAVVAPTTVTDTVIGSGAGNPTVNDTLDMADHDIINVDSLDADTITVNFLTATTYNGLPSTLSTDSERDAAISDSLDIVRADVLSDIHDSIVTPMHYKYIESQPFSWDRPLADTVVVLYNRLVGKDSDTSRCVLVIDSCKDITPSINDTLKFLVAFEDSVTIDTIGIEYMCSSANNYITEINLVGPDRSNGGNFGDSVYYETTTDRDATSWTYLPLDNTDIAAAKGERFGLQIVFTHAADNGAVKVAWIRLAYRKR